MARSSAHRSLKSSKTYEFDHVTSSPTYPQSNGTVENVVKTAQRIMLKALAAGSDPYLGFLDFRNTPTEGLGTSRPTLNSIRQTDVDTLMIRTQSRVRVRVRVIYLNQTGMRHQILGGVGVRVTHSRSDAPSSNPTHSILNCFFP